MTHQTEPILYTVLPAGGGPVRELVAVGGPCAGRRFRFGAHLEIGRLDPSRPTPPGVLAVADPTVSTRHCVLTQDAAGRCFVRDVSRNGTRLDHHRLVPGAEVEIAIGRTLTVCQGVEFRLEEALVEPGEATRPAEAIPAPAPTRPLPTLTTATVLVGDIRHYTTLVREVPADRLQASLGAVFRELERLVTRYDGTVKEYPGDAILAYWEAGPIESCAVRACRAALGLHATACRIAADPAVWQVGGRALGMDWALATGEVLVDSLGGAHPLGLSMVGEPVVRAYRLEKLADAATGPILACAETRRLAGEAFDFREIGPRALEGFTSRQCVFALMVDE